MEEPKHSIGHHLYGIGAFLMLFSATLFQPVSLIYARAINSQDIIELTNEARTRLNKSELKLNQNLMSAAQAKAEDMVAKNYFDHYGPNGETPWKFFIEAGYTYESAGENLAITNESEERVIEGWLNSPTHRENVLNNNYSDLGVGVAYFGDYGSHRNTTVVVAFYGRIKAKELITGTEPTAPAGTMAVLNNDFVNLLNSSYIIVAAVALVVAGLSLEIRHIRQHHKSHQPSY